MMKLTVKPNAYWLRGALPTVEQSRNEYIVAPSTERRHWLTSA